MTAQNKTTLKSYFNAGDQPTEAQFANLIDSAMIIGDDDTLKAWTESRGYELTGITYDATYTDVISTATVKWPDGSAGTLTVDTINTTWGEIDAYHVTHVASGKTVTQALVTRNANGYITTKPALTVA